MIEKRKRGRPLGSGKNDESLLMQVARFRFLDPTLKPTTAMKRVIHSRKDWPETSDTLLRRLQAKWRASGNAFEARAVEEMTLKPPAAHCGAFAGVSSWAYISELETLRQLQEQIGKMFAVPEIIKLQEAAALLGREISEACNLKASVQAAEAMRSFDRELKAHFGGSEFQEFLRAAEAADRQIRGEAEECLRSFRLTPQVRW
jgi:hypothetical protein